MYIIKNHEKKKNYLCSYRTSRTICIKIIYNICPCLGIFVYPRMLHTFSGQNLIETLKYLNYQTISIVVFTILSLIVFSHIVTGRRNIFEHSSTWRVYANWLRKRPNKCNREVLSVRYINIIHMDVILRLSYMLCIIGVCACRHIHTYNSVLAPSKTKSCYQKWFQNV